MPGVSKAIYTNTNTKYKNNKTNVVLHFEFELGSPLYEILAQYGFNNILGINLLRDNSLVIYLLFNVWHFDPAKCS